MTSAQQSEKPSIMAILDLINEAVFRGMDTFAIELQVGSLFTWELGISI